MIPSLDKVEALLIVLLIVVVVEVLVEVTVLLELVGAFSTESFCALTNEKVDETANWQKNVIIYN